MKRVFKKNDRNIILFANDKIYNNQSDNNDVIKQAESVSKLPSLYKDVYLMPDYHKGYGFPIGAVAAFKNVISPGGIGYDVNCGVRLLFLPISKEILLEKKLELLNRISNQVPIGFGSKSNYNNLDFNRVCVEGLTYLNEIGLACENDIINTNYNGSMKGSLDYVSDKAILRGKRSLGSLGAGNHFIDFLEISKIDDNNDYKILNREIIKNRDGILLMIHTGSRGFGHQVITDYIKRIRDENISDFDRLEEKDLAYITKDSEMFNEFLLSMNAAANFAFVNRQLISNQVLDILDDIYKIRGDLIYDISHNLATIEKYDSQQLIVHRKGATLALGGKNFSHKYYKNQPIIVPGSYMSSSYLLFACENDFNLSMQSCCHGSGRSLSRKSAKESFDVFEIKKELRDKSIILKATSKDAILEEYGASYKDSSEIINTIESVGIAKFVIKCEPFIVFQG